MEMLSRSSSSSSFSSSSTSNDDSKQPPLLLALNHVSYVCKSLTKSVKFYEEVLGFMLIKRPSSFNFEGAWLFNHGIGIHLLQGEENMPTTKKEKINPKDNHISFQCTDMELIIRKLEDLDVKYVTALVEEGGITVQQLFFHDPDGHMIEICNCQNLPILPISTCPLKKLEILSSSQTITLPIEGYKVMKAQYFAEAEAIMMRNLELDMMSLSY